MAWGFLRQLAQGDNRPGGGLFGFLNDVARAETKPQEFTRDLIVGGGRQLAKFPETTGRSLSELIVGRDYAQGAPPTDPIRRTLYGSEPVETFQKRAEGQRGVLRESRFRGLDSPLLAPVLVAGTAAVDSPLGLPIKGGIAALVKATTSQEVKKLVPGIADDVAGAVAKATDGKAIENLLRGGRPPQRANIADAVVPPPEKLPAPATPQSVELPRRPNVVERATVSVKGELSRQGEGGQQIANRLGAARDTSETGQGQFIQKIPTVLKLKPDEFQEFHDVLKAIDEGQQITPSPNVQQAVKEWTENIPSIRDEALRVGLDVGDLGPTYFPRSYTELLSTDEGRNIAAQHLVRTGQADNIGEAAMMLDRMKSKYNTPFGHFENSRTADLPGYDISKDSIINYIAGAYNKIGHAEQFGPRGELAKDFITKIADEGHDWERALENYQVAVGLKKYGETASKVSSGIRGFNRFRALGLSSLLNATQSTNTASVSGIWNTARAAFKSFSPTERKYVDDTGVIIDSVLNSLKEQTGLVSGKKATTRVGKAGQKVVDVATAPAFGLVERFNRRVASIAGKDYANKLAAKAASGNSKAEKVLREKLGVKGDIGAKLTPEQEIQAGRKMVELTQFKVDPQDLPNWVDSPGGKLVSQFRTFSYKQTGFVYNQVLKEAYAGNPLPLARFLAVGVPLGVLAGTARNTLRLRPGLAVRGKQDEEEEATDRFAQVMEGLSNIGAFGLGPTDVKFLAQNAASQRFPEYLAGAIGGPTAGLLVGTSQDIQRAAQGSPESLGRRGLKSLSSVGPALQQAVLPYTGLRKDQEEVISKLRGEGASAPQIEAYEQYFKTAPELSKERTKANEAVNRALSEGNIDEAQRLANEYNQKLLEAFGGWNKRYGEYVTQDLQDRFNKRKIVLTATSVKSRLRSIRSSEQPLTGGEL